MPRRSPRRQQRARSLEPDQEDPGRLREPVDQRGVVNPPRGVLALRGAHHHERDGRKEDNPSAHHHRARTGARTQQPHGLRKDHEQREVARGDRQAQASVQKDRLAGQAGSLGRVQRPGEEQEREIRRRSRTRRHVPTERPARTTRRGDRPRRGEPRPAAARRDTSLRGQARHRHAGGAQQRRTAERRPTSPVPEDLPPEP